jgi:hypothetical protein
MKGRDAIIGIDRADSRREKIGSKPQNLTERLALRRSTDERVDLPPIVMGARSVRKARTATITRSFDRVWLQSSQ